MNKDDFKSLSNILTDTEIELVSKVLTNLETIREKMKEKTAAISLEHYTEDERKSFFERVDAHMTDIDFSVPTQEALTVEMSKLRKKVNAEINGLLMKVVKRRKKAAGVDGY